MQISDVLEIIITITLSLSPFVVDKLNENRRFKKKITKAKRDYPEFFKEFQELNNVNKNDFEKKISNIEKLIKKGVSHELCQYKLTLY
jgi:hypothetical protein